MKCLMRTRIDCGDEREVNRAEWETMPRQLCENRGGDTRSRYDN